MARTIGIDTGGTFTDLVAVDADRGEVRLAKVPSTPDDPVRAILEGLARLGEASAADHVVHGTTVALNALLTGRVARVALVTNTGFGDLLAIGRQARPDLYALEPHRTAPLVPPARRFEIPSRDWPDPERPGRMRAVARPGAHELERLVRRVSRSGAESVAVCLLHSWADPSAEREVERALSSLDLPVTCSAVVLPEHREFERFSTAVANAALVPLMREYLGRLGERLAPARLSLLQSTGGTLSAERAAREPVRVLLSGPAGGVVGAARAARDCGFDRFIAFDMGGTSTDVAFHRAGTGDGGEARRATEPVPVAGHPIGVPALDIHTIGCGGGSLVTLDAGGVLHVGPESAGADPGPVCYGASDVPTVTDAHVLLGHVAEGAFLGGELALDHDAVARAFAELGRRLGVSPVEAAEGVLDVARAAMRRAIGVMTMQRGEDPERLPLIAFGGAGGLQAAALAGLLRMPCALVPDAPGALSARGMTAAPPTRDLVRTVLAPLDAWGPRERKELLGELAERGRAELIQAGYRRREVRHELGLDLRYRGQSFELHVPESRDARAAFHAAHERLYGYALPEREIELVRLRARAFVPEPTPPVRRVRRRPRPDRAVTGYRKAWFGARRPRRAEVLDRARLEAGHVVEGPALIEEYSGTTVIPPGQHATVLAGGHLRIATSG